MQIAFYLVASITVLGAVAAMSLRNLVHCALALVVAFGGIAVLFLQLDAQFAGFAQILVSIGAVAILIVFAILLTRGGDTESAAGGSRLSPSWWAGLAVSVLVLASVGSAIHASAKSKRALPPQPQVSIRQLGLQFMAGQPGVAPGHYVLPLEVAGLLLTAAMLGAVVIAMEERRSK